jgi:hypothetical protein
LEEKPVGEEFTYDKDLVENWWKDWK